MEDSRPSLLLKANREIAEVREELAKLDVRVDEIQAKNANYLEEISLQDSEVTRLCARAALSEQKLAEAFQQKRDGQQLREEKQAAREAELSKLRESLREKEEALAQVIIPKETDVGVDVPQADPRELRSELRALESKESAQKSLLETSRQQAAKLTKDIAKERQRMEELHRALRKASEDAASCEENEKALKVAITSKGVDPARVDEAEKEAERVTEELRSELASAEEKCQELRSKLAATTKKGAEDVKDLELTLSSAREDLQRSLEHVREAQRAEAAHAESKMQAERQRANLETLGTNALREQIDKLHESLRKAKASPPKPQGGLMSLLEEDLRRIKQQASNAEQQAEEKAKELLRTKQQQRDVQVQAEEEAIQVKAKIQEIWRHLAAG